MTDMRSPLAKARDEFLDSVEGQKLIKFGGGDQFARNRIMVAWLAGAAWGRAQTKEKEGGDDRSTYGVME